MYRFVFNLFLVLSWVGINAHAQAPTKLPEKVQIKPQILTDGDGAAPPPIRETEVEVAWEKMLGAMAYEMEFQPIEGKDKARRFKTTELNFKAMLPPGPYRFRIRSIDKQGDKGSWSRPVKIIAEPQEVVLQLPTNGEQIEAKKKITVTTFRWDPFKNAKGYIIRIWSDRNKKIKAFKTRKTKTTLNLMAGRKYYWDVMPVSREGVRYQRKSEPFSFVLFGKQLPKPELEILRPKDPKGVGWRRVKLAQYKATLFRKDILGEEWEEYAKNNSLTEGRWLWSRKLKPGHYRVEVMAMAQMRIDSDRSEKEFFVKPKLSEVLPITARP